MKKAVSLFVVCTMVLSFCISAPFQAFAENETNAGNKVYEEVYSNDFENADSSTDTTIVDGDGVNTSKFKTMATGGSFDVNPGTTIADDLVIDFRLKAVDGTTYSTVQAIFQNWGGLVVGATFDGNMSGYNAGWTYYRLFIDSDQATDLAGVTYELYKSADGLSWTKATTKRLTAEDRGAEGSAASRLYNLTQIRFYNAYVDDICIYKCGTAPEAKEASVAFNGEAFEASYTWYDAEGDAKSGESYVWQSSADDVTYADISGATSKIWTPSAAYLGKYIRCIITPSSAKYPTTGEPVATEGVKYAQYIEAYANNFENADPVADTTIVEGDGVNTTKFKTMAKGGSYDIKPGTIIADDMAIDFRLRAAEDTTYSIVQAIFQNWGGLIVELILDGNMAAYNPGWTYYRLFIDSDQATDLSGVTYALYKSADGISWTQATTKKLTIADRGAAGSAASRLYNLTQIRFNNSYVDDICIYKYGTAPVGANGKVTADGDSLIASFDYSDAEGDTQGIAGYAWEVSDDNVTFAPVEGALGATWAPGGKYNGKYVRATITPKSSKYPTDGETIVTESIKYKAGYVEHLFIDYEDKDPEADATIIDGAAAGDTQNTTKYKNGGKNFSINIGSYIPDELTVEFRAKSIPYEENGKEYQYHIIYLIGNNWGGCVTQVIMDAATPGYTTGWNYYRIVYSSIDATAKNEVKVKYFISADGEHWNEISDDVVARKTTVTPPGANGTYADNVNLLRFDRAQVDDIRVYQYGTAPEADGASISITDDGTFATVEGYSDAEGDAEDYPKCQWQYSADNVTFTDIAGQTSYKFNDDGKYDGAYLRCLVYPTSTKWPCYGEAILTDSILFESSKDAYVTYNHFNNSDEPASTYVPAEGFKTVFVANNNTLDLLPLMVVCGVYNIETHELIKVNMETVTLNPEEKGREIPLTNIALTQEEIPSEGTFVKVMVLNANNMKPYNKVGYVLETEAE